MIELTTTLLMLASAFTPATAKIVADAKENAIASEKNDMTIEQAISPNHPLTSVSVEAYVRDYFAKDPILAEIAKCESTFRQFDSRGNVIRGEVNKGDIGIMQINKYYHEEDAVKLGFDIYTFNGNLGYAKWLYAKYGDAPWNNSGKCWKKYREIAMK
ncbi:MAG: hypothetical protein Q7R72_00395 [bacterium]|nr:hypothetical protein [bacterium]